MQNYVRCVTKMCSWWSKSCVLDEHGTKAACSAGVPMTGDAKKTLAGKYFQTVALLLEMICRESNIEHEGQPYCSNCHRKLFAAGGREYNRNGIRVSSTTDINISGGKFIVFLNNINLTSGQQKQLHQLR